MQMDTLPCATAWVNGDCLVHLNKELFCGEQGYMHMITGAIVQHRWTCVLFH